jgi:pyruvate dehydrogenase complex dehydrogenase (E1) component
LVPTVDYMFAADAYVLRRTDRPTVTIAAMGALLPEALTAADRLEQVDVPTDVVCMTNPDLLSRAVRARQSTSRPDHGFSTNRTCSSSSRDKPACSANSSSGTSPACDTRLSSSNTAPSPHQA